MSGPFKIHSVNYIPNSPMAGIFGFFNRKTPHILSSLDRVYEMFSQATGIFHWEVVIEASHASWVTVCGKIEFHAWNSVEMREDSS